LKPTKFAAFLAVVVMAALTLAIAAEAPQPQTKPPKEASKEPERIRVQHVLIGFKGSVRGKNITRTQEEAKKLAYEILDRARKGEDFGALVKQYTDDAFPGIYGMVNDGVTAKQGEFPRRRMVPAFGDTGFPLAVGEVGIADHDATKSPYGWHIVKRIE
jgi:foldase protein PrsA